MTSVVQGLSLGGWGHVHTDTTPLCVCSGRAAGGAGRPLLRREPAAVVLQPGVAHPAGPVLGLRAHADGGLPADHKAAAGQGVQTQR